MAIVSVVTDAREPQWIQHLQFGGVPVVTSMLDAGDIMAATDDGRLILIERKTSSDFLNTLKGERLFPQMARMREISQWSYLVICGTLHSGPNNKTVTDERETGWSWPSIAGALRLVQELGVVVVQVASDFDFEAEVIRIGNETPGAVRIHPPRDLTIVSESEQILASLPGIGGERARQLLEVFGPAGVWQALCWLSMPPDTKVGSEYAVSIPGIAGGTVRKVRRALGLEESMYLAVGFLKEGER